MAYVDTNFVYDKTGVTESQISTEIISRFIEDAEGKVDRIIQTTCNPKQVIELRDGNNMNFLFLNQKPILTLQALEIDSTTIDVEDVVVFRDEGKLQLLTTADQIYFNSSVNPRNIKIKYMYGWLEETDRYTTTTAAETAGSSVSIAVTDASNMHKKDWIKISGFDGNEETTQITAISGNTITADLVRTHESGSTVMLLQVPRIVRFLTGVIAALGATGYMMGSTYNFATGYSLPDYQIQKGEPYPAFQKNMDKLTQERKDLEQEVPGFPVFS